MLSIFDSLIQVYRVVNKTLEWEGKPVRLHGGVHLLTLHERSGQVMRAVSYQTWQPENNKQLSQALQDARDGRLLLLLATVRPTSLTSNIRQHTYTIQLTYSSAYTTIQNSVIKKKCTNRHTIIHTKTYIYKHLHMPIKSDHPQHK